MDFDDIKRKAQQVKAPSIEETDPGAGPCSLDNLVAKLRAADERQRAGLRKALPLYLIATICWCFVFAVMTWFPPKSRLTVDLLFWGSLAGIYVLVTVGVVWAQRHLGKISYSLPTRQFLAVTERRYRFMRLRDYALAGVGCLLLGVAAGPYVVNLLTRRYFGAEYQTLIVVTYCALYVALCAMGFVFTYRNWKRDRRPLWLAVREMLADLTVEEQVGTDESTDAENPRP